MTSERHRLRVSIDTNVFVSSLISGKGPTYAIVQAAYRGDLSIIISREQRDEITEVIQRPQLRRFLPMSEAQLMLSLLAAIDLYERPDKSPVPVRDPKDEHILATAVAADADYLISGDDDLLSLADEPAIAPLQIVTPRQFLDLLESGEPLR